MARQSKSVSLPWKRGKDGLVAELGAVFRVELKAAGWECSVKTGRCKKEVLSEGLATQKEGKARAEAHAARMPEVAAALGKQEKPTTTKKDAPRRARKKAARTSRSTPPAAAESATVEAPAGASPALTFEKLDDGCIFGRVGGACWVADEREVVFARPVEPEVQTQVEQLAAQHFTSVREAEKAKREAARAAAQAEREAARTAAQAEREAARREREAARAARKAAKTTTRATKKTAKVAAKKATKVTTEKPAKTAKRTARKGPRSRKGKAAANGKAAEKEGEPVTTNAAVKWTDRAGELRSVAAHGTFAIQAEGQRHALYFYEPGGQSRHLRSGELAELRKAAEEMAARGQPAPERETLSPEKEEALLRMFASGAVGGA